jgi:hypothetical protein
MLNSTIVIKLKQRLNKLDSQDYDNIECWQAVEAFNKAQVEWSRRQLHGMNQMQEGDEQSTRRKDDLQVLLSKDEITMVDKEDFFSGAIPTDYLQWKRVDAFACKECCEDRRMTIYLAEEGNLNQLLRDKSKKPSFEWAETFATLIDNKIHVYTNNEFDITGSSLTYYRQPRKIQIQGCVDPYTNEESTLNIEWVSKKLKEIIKPIVD